MTATATAMAYFSKRNNADESESAYMENELGKKPANRIANIKSVISEENKHKKGNA